MLKWNHEQHVYSHTLIPTHIRFSPTNVPLLTILSNLIKYVSSITKAKQLHPVTRMLTVFPELLDAVTDGISDEYLHLGLELGFSVGDIKRFRMNNRTNTLEIIREMLNAWMKKNHAEARDTIGWLAMALLNTRGDISSLLDWEDKISRNGRLYTVTQEQFKGRVRLLMSKVTVLYITEISSNVILSNRSIHQSIVLSRT